MRLRRDQESRRRGKFPDNSPTPYPKRKVFSRTKTDDRIPNSPKSVVREDRSRSADSASSSATTNHHNDHLLLRNHQHQQSPVVSVHKLAFITPRPTILPESPPPRRTRWKDVSVSVAPEVTDVGTQPETVILCDSGCQVLVLREMVGREVQTEHSTTTTTSSSPRFTPPPSPSPKTLVSLSLSSPSPLDDVIRTSPLSPAKRRLSSSTPNVQAPSWTPHRTASSEDKAPPDDGGHPEAPPQGIPQEKPHESPPPLPTTEQPEEEPQPPTTSEEQFLSVPSTSCHVAVQTDNDDQLEGNVARFAVLPPHCSKTALYRTASLPVLTSIRNVDEITRSTSPEAEVDIASLAAYFSRNCHNDDLLLVRAFFLWTATKLTLSTKFVKKNRSANEVLASRCGSSKDFVAVFTALCECGGVRVKQVHGFTKHREFPPGYQFRPEDSKESWNTVYFRGSWWLIDCFFASGYLDHDGHFQRHLDEHFFLTDPEQFVWTHFPCNENETNYSKWQLLPQPMTLAQFNTLPQVTSDFFSLGMKLEPLLKFPLEVREQAEIIIAASQPLRYKYHMDFADDEEHSHLNRHVFCRLKEKRIIGSFLVAPPKLGRYVLRVYAKPEKGLQEGSALDYVATFTLKCVKVRHSLQPWPSHDLPWGLTHNFLTLGATLINHFSANIVLWGGKRRLVFRKSVDLLTLHSLYDANGKRVDDKGIVVKEEDKKELRLIIFSPPQLGFYKLLLYGIKKPRVKGKWRVPLIAAFLIENKVSLSTSSKEKKKSKK